jgi:hypothetical protein
MEALTEHQFLTVWTEATGKKGYNKKLFQETLEALKNNGMIVKNWTIPHVSGSLPLTEVKYRATRFAHECRLKGVTTNNDTVNLYEKLYEGNNR